MESRVVQPPSYAFTSSFPSLPSFEKVEKWSGRVIAHIEDALVGGFLLGFAIYYIKSFFDLAQKDGDAPINGRTIVAVKSARERFYAKFIYAMQAVSSSMMFVDWGIDQGWFCSKKAVRLGLKTFSHVISVVFWSYQCWQNLCRIHELPGIIDRAIELGLWKRHELMPELYREYLELFSNFAFVLASGLQLASLFTGIVVASSQIGALVSLSFTLMIASFVVSLFFGADIYVNQARLALAGKQSYIMR